MLCGAHLLATLLSFAPRSGEATKPPLCREPPLHLDESLVSSLPRCSRPSPMQAVVDCHDRRQSVWVQEMIGSCAMPRLSPEGELATPRPRPRSGAVCRGSNCAPDPAPPAALAPSSEALSALPGARFTIAPPTARQVAYSRIDHPPGSSPTRRIERPPRA